MYCANNLKLNFFDVTTNYRTRLKMKHIIKSIIIVLKSSLYILHFCDDQNKSSQKENGYILLVYFKEIFHIILCIN